MKQLTCTQMKTLRDACLANTLSKEQRTLVIRHLQECPQCREALEEARASLPESAPSEAPEREAVGWSALLWIGVLLLIAAFFILPLLLQPREAIHYASIGNNLKQWGLIYKMYANESPGKKFPPLTKYDGLWVPDLSVLYPEYLTDPSIMNDPRSRRNIPAEIYGYTSGKEYFDIEKGTRFMAQNYVYPGWAVYENADFELLERLHTEGNRCVDGINRRDIDKGKDPLYWMREGIERFYITDINNPAASAMAQSLIPVMVARPRIEKPRRKSFFSRWWPVEPTTLVPVLFLDGHVENIPLGELPDHIKALTELFPEPMEE